MRKPNNTTPARNLEQAKARANALYIFAQIQTLEKARPVLLSFDGKVINKRLTDALREATGARFSFDNTYCIFEYYPQRETTQTLETKRIRNPNHAPEDPEQPRYISTTQTAHYCIYPTDQRPRVYGKAKGEEYKVWRAIEEDNTNGNRLQAEPVLFSIGVEVERLKELFKVENRASQDTTNDRNRAKYKKAQELKEKAHALYMQLPVSFRDSNRE